MMILSRSILLSSPHPSTGKFALLLLIVFLGKPPGQALDLPKGLGEVRALRPHLPHTGRVDHHAAHRAWEHLPPGGGVPSLVSFPNPLGDIQRHLPPHLVGDVSIGVECMTKLVEATNGHSLVEAENAICYDIVRGYGLRRSLFWQRRVFFHGTKKQKTSVYRNV